MSGVVLIISILIVIINGFNKHTKISQKDAILDLLDSFNIDDDDGMWIFRSYNGWGNNIDKDKLQWGSKNSAALRLMKQDYADGISELYTDRLSPRIISNAVAKNKTLSQRKSLTGLSNLCWQWGQFIGMYIYIFIFSICPIFLDLDI